MRVAGVVSCQCCRPMLCHPLHCTYCISEQYGQALPFTTTTRLALVKSLAPQRGLQRLPIAANTTKPITNPQ